MSVCVVMAVVVVVLLVVVVVVSVIPRSPFPTLFPVIHVPKA